MNDLLFFTAGFVCCSALIVCHAAVAAWIQSRPVVPPSGRLYVGKLQLARDIIEEIER